MWEQFKQVRGSIKFGVWRQKIIVQQKLMKSRIEERVQKVGVQGIMARGRIIWQVAGKVWDPGKIWQVAGKHGKWQEYINVRETMVGCRNSQRSREIWLVTVKYCKWHGNIANCRERQYVKWLLEKWQWNIPYDGRKSRISTDILLIASKCVK